MKITRLEIVNFRSYARTAFDLADRTYFVGHNNAGKSTAIDALDWAIRGRCRGLDNASREIIELIREGNPDEHTGLGVKVEIDGFGKVQRQTDGKETFLKVKDWSGSNKAQQDQLFEKLRLTDPVLEACLNTEAFLRLHHADAKNLVMGVLDVRIPADVLEPLDIAGPLSLDELERHYKRQFDKRTSAKRDLETHVVYPKPDPIEGEEPGPVEEFADALEEVRDQERELLSNDGEARGRREELRTQIEAARALQGTLEARIRSYGDDPHEALDELETQLQATPAPEAPTRPIVPEPVQTAEEKAEVAAERAESETLRANLVDDRGRLRLIERSVGAIEGHDPAKGCVIDASIPCKTPAKEFAGKLKTIRAEIKDLEKAIADGAGRLDFLSAQIDTRRANADYEHRQRHDEAQKIYDAQLQTYRAALRAREQLQRDVAAARAKVDHHQADSTQLTETMAHLARLESTLKNLGEDVASVAPAELEAVRDRIKRGEALIERVRAWHQDNDRHASTSAEHARLSAIVERLEFVVEKLGPKGLIVDVLDQARRTFEERVNASLEKWGYRLAFTIDPWTVRVNGRKSTQLSISERLRVGVALQLAIAEITGVWFVAIDAVDTLDSANREILGEVIDGWRGQILLAATKDPDYEVPEELPAGVAFYKLELREGLTHVLA